MQVLNYARLYGSGLNHAVEFLKQSGLADEQALRISEKLFATTKGRSCRFDSLIPLAFFFEHRKSEGRGGAGRKK